MTELIVLPITNVGLSIVQGITDYWVEVNGVIGEIDLANVVTVEADRGVYLEYTTYGASKLLEDCEDAFDEDVAANITAATDAADFKTGSAAAKFTVAAAAAAGDHATELIASIDINEMTHLAFWIKSSVDTEAGDLQILLDDTAKCASPLETLDVPALTAGRWKHCLVALANPETDLALISVGLKYTVDIGTCVILLDDIRAVAFPGGRVVERIPVDDFIPGTGFLALHQAVEEDDAKTDRVLKIFFEGPATSALVTV